MLELHGRYSELVQNVFSADQQFYGALDKVTDSLLSGVVGTAWPRCNVIDYMLTLRVCMYVCVSV